MTDPAQPPSAPSSGRQLHKVFFFAAASDILMGLVLAAIGLNKEEQTLTIVGVALAVLGTAVTCWLIVRTSRPELI